MNLKVVRINARGAGRVLSGIQGMTFIVGSEGPDGVVHVRDYRFPGDHFPYQTWSLSQGDYEVVMEAASSPLELLQLKAAAEQDSERVKVLETEVRNLKSTLREAYEWIDDCGAQAGCQAIIDTIDAALAPAVSK